MEKVSALLSKSQQYLRSAAVLLELGDYDSSVSRAYFAMFYAAQAALASENQTVRSRGGIRSAFTRHFVQSGRFPQRAGDLLDRAQQLQETADYAQQPVTDEGEAEQLLSETEAFINSIDALARRRPARA